MLRRLLLFSFLVIVTHAGVYFTFFKRSDAARALLGYKKAETPQIAAEMFKKAIQERKYSYAADYCTPAYAEQLKLSSDAASKLGTALDEFLFQLKERELARDELLLVLYLLDPFPKDISIQVGSSSADRAEAAMTFALPMFVGGQPNSNDWKIRPDMLRTLVQTFPVAAATPNTVRVAMKKIEGEWKFDFPVDPTLANRVGILVQKHMNFVNPIDVIKQEIKNDASTKENVIARVKEELEKASKE
jgi:hypothetical protein